MALEVGSRIGHYDVTALIGEGGMGQVPLCANIVETPSYPFISEQGGKDDSLCW